MREFGDDFLEGDITLYNEGGKPCVLVDGFRAISLSGAGRSAAPGGTRDLTYHVAWQRVPDESPKPALPPLPLDQLKAAAQSALDRVIAFAATPNWRRRFALLTISPPRNWRAGCGKWE